MRMNKSCWGVWALLLLSHTTLAGLLTSNTVREAGNILQMWE